ncbi:hypothetical protein HK096_005298 [Nowakowskiella sp. JEL0078]|nr:hypothetical protein HK096_005298 [Nowakowskiella sp. JEL0078]
MLVVVSTALAVTVCVLALQTGFQTISSIEASLRMTVIDAVTSKIFTMIYSAEDMLIKASVAPAITSYFLQAVANNRNTSMIYSDIINSPIGEYFWTQSLTNPYIVGLGLESNNLDLYIAQPPGGICFQDISTNYTFSFYQNLNFNKTTFLPIIEKDHQVFRLSLKWNPFVRLITFMSESSYASVQKQFMMTLYVPAWEPNWKVISSNIPGKVENWTGVDEHLVSSPSLYNATNHQNELISSSASLVISKFGSFEKIPSSVQIIDMSNGTKYIIDFRRIKNANQLNWILVITTPYSDVWGEIQATQNNTIIIIVVVTAISIALSVAFSYTLTKPVKVLGKVMGEVSSFNFGSLAKGYLDRRSSLEEIAQMQVFKF